MFSVREPDPEPNESDRKAVTDALRKASEGDGSADSEAAALIYGDLKRAAARLMGGERMNHTLQATALAHEAWMRLIDESSLDVGHGSFARRRFQAHAVQAMRRILVDHARARGAEKRGGEARRVPLSETAAFGVDDVDELLDLDEALTELAERKLRAAQIAELRIFGGLTTAEAATAVGTSLATAKVEWALAKARLTSRVRGLREPDSES